MKRPGFVFVIFLTGSLNFFYPDLFAATETIDKEYQGTVLLVDHQSGALGILEDSDENKKQKISFRVNLKEVDVTNASNQELSFDQIEPGDRVDIEMTIKPDGKEAIYEVRDYNRFEKE